MSADDDLVGKVEEKIGWLTADREVEAKGKLRRLDAGTDDDGDAEEVDAEEVVEEAEDDLRQAYGEYDPAVDGEPPATDVRPGDADPAT